MNLNFVSQLEWMMNLIMFDHIFKSTKMIVHPFTISISQLELIGLSWVNVYYCIFQLEFPVLYLRH